MIHPYSQDERRAYRDLELLNNDIKVKTKPQPWENHNVYIRIYKTGLQNDARDMAIEMRENALATEPKEQAPQEMWKTAGTAAGIWASMIASQQSQQNPSTADVSA
jgi:hypothetical protein